MILVTNLAAVSHHDTFAGASRQARRWLRRRVAVAGEWATILSPVTGAVRAPRDRRAEVDVHLRRHEHDVHAAGHSVFTRLYLLRNSSVPGLQDVRYPQ